MSRRGVVLALACLVSTSVALSACAPPDYTFAKLGPGAAPDAGTVYFKVPRAWTQLPEKQIAKAESGWGQDPTAGPLLKATAWQTAYDASVQPTVEHVLGRSGSDQPTVYASLRTLYDGERAGATVAALRDLVAPVTTLTSSKAITLTTDDQLNQSGVTGVHLVFSYAGSAGQPAQTVDQTAYLSAGNDAIYLFVVRCTTACYDIHRDEIKSVTTSYTIREDRRG